MASQSEFRKAVLSLVSAKTGRIIRHLHTDWDAGESSRVILSLVGDMKAGTVDTVSRVDGAAIPAFPVAITELAPDSIVLFRAEVQTVIPVDFRHDVLGVKGNGLASSEFWLAVSSLNEIAIFGKSKEGYFAQSLTHLFGDETEDMLDNVLRVFRAAMKADVTSPSFTKDDTQQVMRRTDKGSHVLISGKDEPSKEWVATPWGLNALEMRKKLSRDMKRWNKWRGYVVVAPKADDDTADAVPAEPVPAEPVPVASGRRATSAAKK